MSKESNHIDDYFRDGLKDLEFTAPEDSWKNIENQLDGKRRGGIITIWTGLAAGLALLIGLGVYMKYATHDQKTIKRDQISNAIQIKSNPKPEILDNKNFAAQTINGERERVNEPKKTTTSIVTENNTTKKSKQTNNNNNKINLIENNHFNINSINSVNKDNPDDNQTKASDEKLFASKQPSGTGQGYIIPLGIDLKNNFKSTLSLKKEKSTENNPVIEPNLVLDESINIPESNKIDHWSITGQVAPLYSYRKSGQQTGTNHNNEKGLIAYAGGIKVDYKTSRRFSIQTGIFYSVMGQTWDSDGSNYAAAYQNNVATLSNNVVYSTSNSMGPIVNKSNNSRNFNQLPLNNANDVSKTYYTSNLTVTNVSAYQNAGQTVTFTQELRFVEVPILARFKLIDKKIGINLLGGIGANFLVNKNVTLGESYVSNLETGDLHNVNYSGTIGLGISYGFLKKFDLSIEPTYEYYLNSISSDKDLNYHPYAFGVYTGIIYKF